MRRGQGQHLVGGGVEGIVVSRVEHEHLGVIIASDHLKLFHFTCTMHYTRERQASGTEGLTRKAFAVGKGQRSTREITRLGPGEPDRSDKIHNYG